MWITTQLGQRWRLLSTPVASRHWLTMALTHSRRMLHEYDDHGKRSCSRSATRPRGAQGTGDRKPNTSFGTIAKGDQTDGVGNQVRWIDSFWCRSRLCRVGTARA